MYHWAQAVASDKKRKTEGSFHLTDTKVFDHGFGASAVDCGADIDREGEEAYLERHEDFFECGPIQWHLIPINLMFHDFGSQSDHTSGSSSPNQVTIVMSLPFSVSTLWAVIVL